MVFYSIMPNLDVMYKMPNKRQSECHFIEGDEQEVNAAQQPDSQIIFSILSFC